VKIDWTQVFVRENQNGFIAVHKSTSIQLNLFVHCRHCLGYTLHCLRHCVVWFQCLDLQRNSLDVRTHQDKLLDVASRSYQVLRHDFYRILQKQRIRYNITMSIGLCEVPLHRKCPGAPYKNQWQNAWLNNSLQPPIYNSLKPTVAIWVQL